MIWLALAVLVAASLAPFAFSLAGGVGLRGRREAALALHRMQLRELDRDLADERIAPPEHAMAVLEVQRRLLTEAGTADPPPAMRSRAPLWTALVLVPVAALLLYLPGGSPELPAAPLAQRQAAAQQRVQEEAALIDRLRGVLLM